MLESRRIGNYAIKDLGTFCQKAVGNGKVLVSKRIGNCHKSAHKSLKILKVASKFCSLAVAEVTFLMQFCPEKFSNLCAQVRKAH